jgi:DNA mismatch repair ATPase MutS
MKGVYYPHLKDDAVKNDINCTDNNIVTGPNAAGKTTMVKSVIINVLLSQQFGCGFYDTCKINPYDQIHSYINIPDTSGRDSLFQAEATRCKHILSSISENPDDNVLCVFDELFSGTNPYEAISAASAYLKHICSLKNVSFLLTTHFLDLCKKLDKLDNVKNMQMQVVTKDNDFQYTYKVINGISKVKGGIKVLRDLGYPEHIVDDSSKIIKTLKI